MGVEYGNSLHYITENPTPSSQRRTVAGVASYLTVRPGPKLHTRGVKKDSLTQ